MIPGILNFRKLTEDPLQPQAEICVCCQVPSAPAFSVEVRIGVNSTSLREIRLRRQLYHSRLNMIFQEHNELMKSSDFFLTSSTPPKGFIPEPLGRSGGERRRRSSETRGLFISL